MRIRYLKNTPEILEKAPLVVQQPVELKGRWRQHLAQQMGREPEKIYLEIGCGMGGFVRGMARQHTADGFVGLEKFSTVLARAVGTVDPEVDTNVALVRADAENLLDIFAPGEVDGIFLNFSDPWPKERHIKRRLTSGRFLPLYTQVLKKGGILRFKTDNQDLFEFSVESFEQNKWQIRRLTRDLHKKDEAMAEGNVMTEYEEKFTILGKKINCLEAEPIRRE